MKTKKQKKEDSKMKALLKQIPEGETMILVQTEDGKTAIFITQKQKTKYII